MSFIVVPADTTLFRVNVSKISADLDKVNANWSNFTFTGNFDMFRTFTTPVANNNAVQPIWEGFEMMFLYQTEMPEMLVAKRFAMSLSCKNSASDDIVDDFVGESEVDLLTLAAGPKDITLQIRDGDTVVGRLYMEVTMEEVSEMKATLSNLKLTTTANCCYDASVFKVVVLKKKAPDDVIAATSVYSKRPSGEQVLELTVRPHLFATTFPDLYQDDGFEFRVLESAFCGDSITGTGSVLFANAEIQYDDSRINGHFSFSCEVSGKDAIGNMTGDCQLEHIPRFSQMHQGLTVDGVVCYGVKFPDATILPPFVSEEHKAGSDARV